MLIDFMLIVDLHVAIYNTRLLAPFGRQSQDPRNLSITETQIQRRWPLLDEIKLKLDAP